MRAAGIHADYRVVPNAVDTSVFRPGPGGGGSRLVTVAMLRHEKGLDVLLRALAQVRDRHADVRLDIVGEGPARAELERLRAELRLDDQVTLHGFLRKAEIPGLLASSDLFVLPSRFDNNPCVLVEAQAAGLPVVASRVGGIPEIVEGYGLLAAPDAPDELAARIIEALDRPERFDRAAIAERARSTYSFGAVGDLLGSVYDEVRSRR